MGWGNASGPFAGTFALGTAGSNPILFVVNSGEVARFSGAGKLGIGTPTPSALLTVAGTLTATGTTTLSSLTTAGVVLNSAAGVLSSSAGPLAVANGGTGLASGTQYGLPYFSTTTAMTSTGAGTTGEFLEAASSGPPTWQVPSVPLSSLTSALAGNTLANANNAQVWNWATLATGTALTLADTDASATTATTLAVTNAATGAGYGITSTLSGASNSGAAVFGTNTGTSNTGYAGLFTNSGTTNGGAALALKNTSSTGYDLAFFDSGDSNVTLIAAPATMATSQALILPAVAGTNGQVLTNSGGNPQTLSWSSSVGNGQDILGGGGLAGTAGDYYPLMGTATAGTEAAAGGTPIPIVGILRNFCVRTAAAGTASVITLYDGATNTGIHLTASASADTTVCDNTDTYTIAANDVIFVEVATTTASKLFWTVEFDPGSVLPTACTGVTPTWSAAFTNLSGVATSIVETSNCVEVTGLTCAIPISISGVAGGTYQVFTSPTCASGGSGFTTGAGHQQRDGRGAANEQLGHGRIHRQLHAHRQRHRPALERRDRERQLLRFSHDRHGLRGRHCLCGAVRQRGADVHHPLR